MPPRPHHIEDTSKRTSIVSVRGAASHVKKIKKILLAINYITAKVSATSVYKRHIEDTCVELYKQIKDMPESVTNEDILALQKNAELLDVLCHTLVARGEVRATLYTFVHQALVAVFAAARREGDSHTDGGADSTHNIDARLVQIVAGDTLDFPEDFGDALSSMGATSTAYDSSAHRGAHRYSSVPAQFGARGSVGSRGTASKKDTYATPKLRQASATRIAQNKGQRTEDIYTFIQKTGTVGVPQVATQFTGVSGKTIQRELVALLAAGRIVKQGDRRWTTYSLPAA
jgi:hypothetical protein